jgi:metal-responsive CopG/Arc/MetJ family transcriptional regulator
MEFSKERRTPKCFCLPTSLLDELDKLPRRSQSRWVEDAIRERLDRETAKESGRQGK